MIEENKSLKNHNTFGIDCKARYFTSVSDVSELKKVLSAKPKDLPVFILGGGSNILLTQDLEAFVVHINFKGIEVVYETEDSVHLKVQAVENWHEFVLFCISKNYGGIENLSLIPGNVGTAPIQNIGAYGVELKDVFESCTVLDINDLTEKVITGDEAKFGYRDSIFKNEAKGKYIITSVTFRLTKKNHQIRTGYGDIQKILAERAIDHPGIKDLSDAIIQIRQSKLPDPKILGNGGSFFKNPVLNQKDFDRFYSNFPDAPYYRVSENEFKVPAAWLIEKVGFKGSRFGDAGVHKIQALVLVNYGNATGKEIHELSIKIQEKVKEITGIKIEPEVTIL